MRITKEGKMKKMTLRMKRVLLILLVAAMLVPSIGGLAATKKQKALTAYDKWLSQSTVYLMKKGGQYLSMKEGDVIKYAGTKSSAVKFSVAYLDNDSIPELIVLDSVDQLYCVLAYKNGKVVRVNSGEMATIPRKYFAKKGVLVTSRSWSPKVVQYVCKASGKYFVKFQNDVKGCVEYFLSKSSKGISSAQLKTRLKVYTKGIKATKITYRKNTKASRKKYLK